MHERPTVTRLHWLSIGLVAGGAVVCLLVTLANMFSLGWWQLPLYLGVVSALVGVWWFGRELTTEEIEIENLRRKVADANAQLVEENQKLDESRKIIERAFREQASQLDQREQALASRLAAFNEWLEFPTPINLASAQRELPEADGELRRLVEKDRQLNDLLKAETATLFEYIKDNRYSVEGKFQLAILRDDLHILTSKVARIYQPDIGQPLLETSIEQVMRAGGRACLQFLVVLDELPISVKDYNINSLYTYIRQAVKAYGLYKSTEPYWNYINTAWYVGRFAMGANPITLGAWWFLGTLGKHGAKTLTTRVVNRHALALLQNVVRVVGYEVASMYGGDFRHRDANWIYGAELTELVAKFPISRDSLRHALRELGALQLRSEYDRVFLTRCLANGSTAHPERYRSSALLSMEERRAIAQRLERFLEAFVHGKTPERIHLWHQEVEQRLDVKMSVAGVPTSANHETQLRDALRSLTGFLVTVKEQDLEAVPKLLARTQLWAALEGGARRSIEEELREAPAYLFEQPDLDPDSEIAKMYLDDIAMLAARVPPHEVGMDELVRDIAHYLRFDPKKMSALVEQHLAAVLNERFVHAAPQKFPSMVARAALDLLLDERAEFLYGGVKLDGTMNGQARESFWLLGTATRLVLFSVGQQPQAWWKATSPPTVTLQKKLLQSEARISGGTWLIGGDATRTFRVSGPVLSRRDSFFLPLLQWKPQLLAIGVSSDAVMIEGGSDASP